MGHEDLIPSIDGFFERMSVVFKAIGHRVLSPFPAMWKWFPTSEDRKVTQASTEMFDVVRRTIKRHREQLPDQTTSAQGLRPAGQKTLLAHLLESDFIEEELIGNIGQLLMAGYGKG